MPTPDVIDRALALHEQLEREPHPALDPVQRQLAQIALEPHDAAHYQSLSEKLEAAYDTLAAEHPKLAAAVRATMNALSAAGL